MALCPVAWADETYPSKVIEVVVPYGPAGASDLGARIIAEKMSEFLGKPIIVIDKPGAGGVVGTSFVAHAKPDGYTIGVCDMNTVALAPVIQKTDYSLDDFTLLGTYLTAPIKLVVKAGSNWKKLNDLTADARRNPEKITIANYGELTSADFAIRLYSKAAGISFRQIPYKSSAEAITAVLGGHVDAAVVVTTGGLIESGKIRVLAITGEKRLPELPEIPTFEEFGYAGIPATYHCYCVPRGTPGDVIAKLNDTQKKVFARYGQQIKERLLKAEAYADFRDPEETSAIYRKQRELLKQAAQRLFGLGTK